ncbi:MAG: cupin domain-containing protein [bacterium]
MESKTVMAPKVIPHTNISAKPVKMEGVKDATIRELITAADGAPNFAMRVFEVAPGGHTPLHDHNYEHEIFILEGQGRLNGGEKAKPLKKGDAVFVPANATHQFENTGAEPLKFICLIPVQKSCT